MRLGANATWLEAEVKKTGVDLPGRAPLEISGRIRLGDPDRYKLGFEVHYTDELPVSLGGTQTLSARTVLDLTAAVELLSIRAVEAWRHETLGIGAADSRIWLALRARNLTDRSVRDALFFPQPGRSLTFSLEGSF